MTSPADRPDDTAGLPADGSADRPGPRHARPKAKDPLDIRLAIIIPSVLVAAVTVFVLMAGPPPDRTLGPARSKAPTSAPPTPTLSPATSKPAVATAQVSPLESTRPHTRPAPRQQTIPRGRPAPKAAPRWAPGPARSTTPPPESPSTPPAPVPGDAGTKTATPSSPLGRFLDLLRRRT